MSAVLLGEKSIQKPCLGFSPLTWAVRGSASGSWGLILQSLLCGDISAKENSRVGDHVAISWKNCSHPS